MLVLVSASCSRESIQTYKIPKESASTPTPEVTASMAPAAPGISWTAPDGWEARPPTSVRVGNYAIPNPAGGDPGDFAITTFPGDVGGDLANVNRWRNQIGLGPIAAADLPEVLKSVAAPAGEFFVVNFANSDAGVRVIAALFKQSDRTWFFKLAGPDALVASQEAALLGLLQTVKFEAGLVPPDGVVASGGPPMNTNDLPPGHPPIGGLAPDGTTPAATAVTSTGGDLPIRWAAPDHWIAKELGQLRKGSYTVHGSGSETGDFSVIALAGAAGGLHDNVNRWRGQIGLPPADGASIDAGVRHLDSAGMHFDVVEFASDGPDAQRVIGALLTLGNETWFFKLTGPDKLVASERDSFIQFIRTVRIR